MAQDYTRDSVKGNSVRAGGTCDLCKLALRQLLPLGLSLGFLVLLWDRAAGLDFKGISAGLGQVRTVEWLLAAGLSMASFWAVGRYDAVVHRITGTGIKSVEATRAGVTAIAVAQTVGFGVISGALVRWRMLPGLSLLQAIKVSVTVSLSFLAGWAFVSACAVLFSPTALPFPATPKLAGFTIGAAAIFACLSLIRPGLLGRINLPSLQAMGTIVLLSLVDTVAAGGALYALLPDSVHIDLPTFIAAFLVALGAGLILGTPGGVGPFEVMLITLLPQIEVANLLTAILAFRVLYYAIPALIGAVLVIRGPRKSDDIQPSRLPNIDNLIRTAPTAEAALLRHNRLSVLEQTCMVRASGQSLIMLRGALTTNNSDQNTIALVQDAADKRFLTPCLYKAPAKLASAARRAGWQVLPVAREAWIDPRTYATDGRAYRQLRRKLRKAEVAGITITDAKADLPLDAMALIATDWACAHGGERGFSMGVFEPKAIKHARVYLVWQHGTLVGFLTLHENKHEQVLDLMRFGADTPDGCMHLALDFALRTAASEKVSRLSLASVPIGAQSQENTMFRILRQHMDKISGAGGLRQFKTAFAPNWETLYLSAPSRAGMVMAAIDITREIVSGKTA